MKFYAVVAPEESAPELLFRAPDAGGPPTELWDPETDEWDEDVSLLGYFTGDLIGAIEVDPTEVPDVQKMLKTTKEKTP